MIKTNLPLGRLLLGLAMMSCETNIISRQFEKITWKGEFSIQPVQRLSYDVASVTTRTTSDPSVGDVDQVNTVPVFAKESVRVAIDPMGLTEMIIEKNTPDDQPPASEVPAGAERDVKFLRIQNNMGEFYDENGVLLFSDSIPSPVFNPQQFIYPLDEDNFRRMISRLEAQGALVADMHNGSYQIRMHKPGYDKAYPSNLRVKEEGDQLANAYVVFVLDTLTSAPVVSGIYNAADQLLDKTYYKYTSNDDGDMVLFATQHHSYHQDAATGQTVETQTNTIYSNVTIN